MRGKNLELINLRTQRIAELCDLRLLKRIAIIASIMFTLLPPASVTVVDVVLSFWIRLVNFTLWTKMCNTDC